MGKKSKPNRNSTTTSLQAQSAAIPAVKHSISDIQKERLLLRYLYAQEEIS